MPSASLPRSSNELVDAYLRAGKFTAAPAIGEALNPNRDFIEKAVPASVMDPLLAELGAGGKDFPPESPRGLLATGTREASELAAKANPRWAAPHFRLAELETNPPEKIQGTESGGFARAAQCRALASARGSANRQSGLCRCREILVRSRARGSVRGGARSHPQAVHDLDDSRAALEAADKRRAEDEKARELQRAKDNAAAEVHAAEKAANLRLGGRKPAQAPVDWWAEPAGEKVSGSLSRVDCLNGPMRLTIQIDGGGTIKLMVRDPKHLTVPIDGKSDFSCGVQKPVRNIRVIFAVKADAKLDTVGDVAIVEFP